MELAITLAAFATLIGLFYLAWSFSSANPKLNDPNARARKHFTEVADAVGGLVVVEDDHGVLSLRGVVDGITVEIDYQNSVTRGLEALLGMRCRLTEAEHAPNAALWIGEVEGLRRQFGRPRPSGDVNGLFEVYTRFEPSASDWWQDPDLHESLTVLRGGGLLLVDGQLTVVFSLLDAESVRTALSIPSLIRRGVQRVTLH